MHFQGKTGREGSVMNARAPSRKAHSNEPRIGAPANNGRTANKPYYIAAINCSAILNLSDAGSPLPRAPLPFSKLNQLAVTDNYPRRFPFTGREITTLDWPIRKARGLETLEPRSNPLPPWICTPLSLGENDFLLHHAYTRSCYDCNF